MAQGAETDTTRPRALPVFFLLTVAAFWPTLTALPAHWSSYNEHGFVVAALVGWLIWRDRGRIAASAGSPERDLLPVLAMASVVWLLARVIDVDSAHHLVFYALIFGWVVAVYGRAVLRFALPIFLTALIAAPLGDLVVPALQRIATIVTGAVTTLGGVEAEIGAYTIAISTGTFVVEEGCSGLNYLMVSLTLGAVYAHLFVRGARTQLRVMAVAAATALLANWIRISALVFVGAATDMQSSLISDHLGFGWVVFTVMLVPAYLVIRWIERRSAGQAVDGSPASEAEASGVASADDPQAAASGPDVTHGPAAERGSGQDRMATARLATAAAVAGPVLYMLIGVLPRAGEIDPSPEIFGVVGPAEVSETTTPVWTPTFTGIDARADWTITRSGQDGPPILASRLWFVDQRQGEELVQGVNAIAPDSMTVSSHFVSAAGSRTRIVRETVLYDGDAPRIAWSWYRVAGRETPFARNAKLLEIWAWLTRAGPSELITMSARCEPDSCEAAAIALRDLVSAEAGG